MGHASLALATSISAISSAILLFNSLNKKLGGIEITKYIEYFVKCGLSAVIMGIVVYLANILFTRVFTYSSFTVQLIRLVLVVIIGGSTYFTICYLLKIKEMRNFFNSIKAVKNS